MSLFNSESGFKRSGQNSDSVFWDFLQNHLSLYVQTYQSLHTPTWQSKLKPVSNHLPSEWENGRRNLATGSINALQTTPTNEMLSFHFSRCCLSQSQGSRREREFCSLNLEFRYENEIFFINISGFETRPRYFLSSLMFRDGTSRRD